MQEVFFLPEKWLRNVIKLYGHLITGFGFINKHQNIAILDDIITEITQKDDGYTIKSLELRLMDMQENYIQHFSNQTFAKTNEERGFTAFVIACKKKQGSDKYEQAKQLLLSLSELLAAYMAGNTTGIGTGARSEAEARESIMVPAGASDEPGK